VVHLLLAVGLEKKATAEEKMPEGKSRKYEKWQARETGYGGLNIDKQ
jgi:hypothetical protein